MRRVVPRVVIAGLLIIAALAVPVSAAAAPLAGSAPTTCPKPKPYPPPPNATVQSSTTTPRVGQTIEASGIGYCPNEDVTITIAGKNVGTAHTDAAGSFRLTVVLPGPGGQKLLCGIGASGLSTDRDCLTLTVSGAAANDASASTAAGGGGGGTAFTGTEAALLLALAILLLAGGIAFATAGRHRRPVSQL